MIKSLSLKDYKSKGWIPRGRPLVGHSGQSAAAATQPLPSRLASLYSLVRVLSAEVHERLLFREMLIVIGNSPGLLRSITDLSLH